MGKRDRDSCTGRRHAGLAWLAIVALLIDVLLPTALSAAAGPAHTGIGVYCGAEPDKSGPAKQGQTAPHHCVFCLAMTTGLAPGQPPAVPAPQLAEIASAGFGVFEAISEPVCHMAAQPRGPPVVV